jgi:transcriptional regulator with XRE-family HTH domain
MRTTIGERVRTYRLRRGLTQARLAHLIGRSERWLIDVERGEVDPRLSDAVALATVLSVLLDDLAGVPTAAGKRAGRPPPRPPELTAGGRPLHLRASPGPLGAPESFADDWHNSPERSCGSLCSRPPTVSAGDEGDRASSHGSNRQLAPRPGGCRGRL